MSLRDKVLWLRALRGTLEVDGRPLVECVLSAGQVITLAPNCALRVEAVAIPSRCFSLQVGSERSWILGYDPISVLDARLPIDEARVIGRVGDVTVVTDVDFRAALILCQRDDELVQLLAAHRESRPIEVPVRWTIGATELHVEARPLPETLKTQWVTARAPLRLVVRRSTVSVAVHGETFVVLSGKSASVIRHLMKLGNGPCPWEGVAERIWGSKSDRSVLRTNWDKALGRLRRQLESNCIRKDLVQLDGAGSVELLLHPGDELIDETGAT